MRTKLHSNFVCLAAAIFALPLSARAELPPLRESPAATVSLDIGATTVKIEYHRPGVKGREIWGKLVPYGEVWRTGANEATTITFDDAVKVEGKDIAKGTYAFFAIPTKDKWTLILSKQAKIWGSFDYKQAEDVARFDVKPEAAPMTEWMAYDITPTSDHAARIDLSWEKLRVPMNVEVDVNGTYKKRVLDSVAAAKADDPNSAGTFMQAAQYWNQQDLDPKQALAWIDQSIKLKETFRALEIKGNILHKMGRGKEAVAAMERALVVAKGVAPGPFFDRVKKTMDGWKK